MYKKSYYLMLIAIIVFPLFLTAQIKYGTLSGRVIDKLTHQPISGVAISINNGDVRAITDDKGRYLIRDIKAQRYTVSFKFIGYQTLAKTNVIVKPFWNTTLNVELEHKAIEISGIKIGSKYFVKSKDAVVSAKNMDIREISQQPGGVYDVQKAIQALPAVVSGSDQNNEIIVRGGMYGENLFVMDNIELTNPNHFAWQGTGGGPVNIIHTDLINNIDFYAGAFPAKYGNKASSVLDITLRKGDMNKYIGKADVGMAGYGGSFEGPIIKSKGSFIVTYHKSFLSLIKSSFGLTAVPYYQSYQGKQVIKISEKNSIILNQLWGNDKIFIEAEEGGTYSENDYDIDARTEQYALGITWKNLFNTKGYYLLTLYRNSNQWRHNIYKASTDTINYYNHSDEIVNAGKFDLTYKLFDRAEVKCGLKLENLDISHNRWSEPDTLFHYDEYGNIDSVEINPATGEPYIYQIDLDEKINSNRYAGYFQTKVNFLKYFVFNSGIRYQYFKYTNDTNISPRLGLTVNLPYRTSLNFGYGKHFQNPEYYQLTLHPKNSNLKSKYTDHYIVGLEHYFTDDLKGSMEAYYKKYQDVPVNKSMLTPDPNDKNKEMINEGTGYAKGVEFFLQKHIKENLWGTLSYSYSISRAKDLRYNEYYNWDFDYGHIFTGIIGYKFEFMNYDWYQNIRDKWWMKAFSWTYLLPSDETEIAVKYRYLGGKPYTKETYIDSLRRWRVLPTQDINDKRLPLYQRLDFFLTHRRFFGKINLVTYLNIENLFNHPNIWDYSYKDNGDIETVYQVARMIVSGVAIEF